VQRSVNPRGGGVVEDHVAVFAAADGQPRPIDERTAVVVPRADNRWSSRSDARGQPRLFDTLHPVLDLRAGRHEHRVAAELVELRDRALVLCARLELGQPLERRLGLPHVPGAPGDLGVEALLRRRGGVSMLQREQLAVDPLVLGLDPGPERRHGLLLGCDLRPQRLHLGGAGLDVTPGREEHAPVLQRRELRLVVREGLHRLVLGAPAQRGLRGAQAADPLLTELRRVRRG